jgi:hypothetical protein
MDTTNVQSPNPGATAACCVPLIYVDGQRRRDLAVTAWEQAEAPNFGRVEMQLLHDAQGQAVRMEDLPDLVPIGSSVLITEPSGGGEFRGVVSAHRSQAQEQGESLSAVAVHELTDILRPILGSFVQLGEDGLVTLPGAEIPFNKRLTGMCSSGPVTVGARQACVFSAAATSRSWTVADALGYLLATAVPADVQTQSLDDLNSLAGYIDLGELNIAGMTVLDALVRIAKRGGLAVRAAGQGVGLIVYRPGVAGRSMEVQLQQAGSTFSPAASNLCRSDVTILRRPWRKSVLAVGQAKRYESTFTLLPGWDRSLETTRWRDFVRSMSGDWERRCDVYRKWVLNEHGWYSAPPWNLATYDFAAISATDFCLPTPRQLLPCLSTNPNQQSLGVVVEVRTDPAKPWRQWRGSVWASRDECAVYFGEDALGGEYFQAVSQGTAQVRVTATIEADAKLQVLANGDPGCGMEVLDLSARAAWRKVYAGSVFYRDAELGPPAERDDTDLLTRSAARCQQSFAQCVQARLELGWIDTGFQVGDAVERIDGRDLDLQADDTTPAVAAVRHDFLKQSTILEVQG